VKIKKVDRWLKREGVKSNELARYLGISKSAISKWRVRDSIPLKLDPILKMILSCDRHFLQRKQARRSPELF